MTRPTTSQRRTARMARSTDSPSAPSGESVAEKRYNVTENAEGGDSYLPARTTKLIHRADARSTDSPSAPSTEPGRNLHHTR